MAHLRKALPVATVSALAALQLTACDGASDATAGTVRRDSAGIEIVESERPRWRDGRGWRVDSVPSLTIGSALDGDPAVQFTRVSGVARLSDRRIAVVDDQTAELRIFDADGRHLATAGGKGGGPGEYMPPIRLLLLPGDTLLLAGGFQAPRLGLHAGDGRFVRMLELPPVGDDRRPSTLAWRFDDGTSLISAGGFRVVQPRGGTWTDSIAYYRLRAGTDSATLIGSFPAIRFSGSGPAVARVAYSPSSEMAQHGNRLHIGYPESYEIATYTSDGGLMRVVRRAWTPVPVDQAAKDGLTQRMYGELPPPMKERYTSVLTFADHHPAYDELKADAEGNVWARAPRVDPAGLGGSEGPPVPMHWSVFDTSGAWLGDVTLPAGLEPHQIGTDFVLGVLRDDEGVSYVRMHRLVKDP